MQGAYGFLACEIAEGAWLFVPPETSDDVDSVLAMREGKAQNPTASKLAPFTFNPIHDIESLWWLAFWSLSRHVPVDNRILSSTKRGPLQWMHSRIMFLQSQEIQLKWRQSLPSCLRKHAQLVCGWSRNIVSCYKIAEADLESALVFSAYRDVAAPRSAVEYLTINFDEDTQLKVADFNIWLLSLFTAPLFDLSGQGSGSHASKRPSKEVEGVEDADAATKRARPETVSGDPEMDT
jgi:hypothetical protein